MGAAGTGELRERIARAKRAHPLLAKVRAEGIALRPCGRGRRQARCPFHNDRHPSLTLYEDGGRFRCFGCAAGWTCRRRWSCSTAPRRPARRSRPPILSRNRAAG